MPTSRATRVTSEVKTPSCLIMVLTIVAERRNSPLSGRPSTSSGTVLSRSPCATAVMARVTSVVGQTRSSIRVLMEFSISPQAPLGAAKFHALFGLSFAANDLADALQLLCHALIGGDDFIESIGNLAFDADVVTGHANGKIPAPHGLQGGEQFS